MKTIEILDTYKIPTSNKLAAKIQLPEGTQPQVGDVFFTTDKRKVRITGVELSIKGEIKQLNKWQEDREMGKHNCLIEFIN